MKLFLDPRQAHVKTIKAGLEALLERLGLIRHGLLLSTSRGTGNDKGHTRRDPADDRNAGHHHHGAHQTTRKRDRHMIPVPRGRHGGEAHQRLSPQEPNVPPGTPRSSSHTAEPPRSTTPADTPETMMTVRSAVSRATEPLVVPTKSSSLGTHCATFSMGVVDFLHEICTRVRVVADRTGR